MSQNPFLAIEQILGWKGLRPDLETPWVENFINSSESGFQVKKVGGFGRAFSICIPNTPIVLFEVFIFFHFPL